MELFHFFIMKPLGVESFGSGGDVSTSGGEGDLGAARSSLEVWTDTGNRWKDSPWN